MLQARGEKKRLPFAEAKKKGKAVNLRPALFIGIFSLALLNNHQGNNHQAISWEGVTTAPNFSLRASSPFFCSSRISKRRGGTLASFP